MAKSRTSDGPFPCHLFLSNIDYFHYRKCKCKYKHELSNISRVNAAFTRTHAPGKMYIHLVDSFPSVICVYTCTRWRLTRTASHFTAVPCSTTSFRALWAIRKPHPLAHQPHRDKITPAYIIASTARFTHFSTHYWENWAKRFHGVLFILPVKRCYGYDCVLHNHRFLCTLQPIHHRLLQCVRVIYRHHTARFCIF